MKQMAMLGPDGRRPTIRIAARSNQSDRRAVCGLVFERIVAASNLAAVP
jgi:hypothetical protein